MCEHKWRRIHEESILGGSFLIGYRCILCNEFVSQNDLTPDGLSGQVTKEHELIAPLALHGGHGYTSDGKIYEKQIIHEDGTLEIKYAKR